MLDPLVGNTGHAPFGVRTTIQGAIAATTIHSKIAMTGSSAEKLDLPWHRNCRRFPAEIVVAMSLLYEINHS